MPNQATALSVYDAGLLRLRELGASILELEATCQDTAQVDYKACDLRFALESTARLSDATQAVTVQSYAQETYGLLSVGLDPLLAPYLPVIPARGAEIRPNVLRASSGGPLLRISPGGPVLRVGARLVPNTNPVYNTPLTPGQTVGAVSYNGLTDTVFSFDGPAPLTGGGLFLKLFVGSVQVGRVDFATSQLGDGFSELYQGTTYYGQFQQTSDNTLALYDVSAT